MIYAIIKRIIYIIGLILMSILGDFIGSKCKRTMKLMRFLAILIMISLCGIAFWVAMSNDIAVIICMGIFILCLCINRSARV